MYFIQLQLYQGQIFNKRMYFEVQRLLEGGTC